MQEGGDKVIGDLEELGPWCAGPWKNLTTSTTGRERTRRRTTSSCSLLQLLNLLLIPPVYQTQLKVRGQKPKWFSTYGSTFKGTELKEKNQQEMGEVGFAKNSQYRSDNVELCLSPAPQNGIMIKKHIRCFVFKIWLTLKNHPTLEHFKIRPVSILPHDSYTLHK